MATVKHSARFDKVQLYYQIEAWSVAMVKNAVVKGWITEEEYAEITGESYAE